MGKQSSNDADLAARDMLAQEARDLREMVRDDSRQAFFNRDYFGAVEAQHQRMIQDIQEARNAEQAVGFHERLMEHVQEFDQSLDSAHEVGIRLVSFGQSITFHLRGIGFHNPALIIFLGETDKGEPVKLIQHMSQISVLLMKMKRPNFTAPKEPFGFYDRRKKGTDATSSDPSPG